MLTPWRSRARQGRALHTLILATTALFTIVPVATADDFNATYTAATGVLPSAACPAWTTNQAGGTSSLSGGDLLISTTSASQNLTYKQSGAQLAIPQKLVIEAEMKLDSGSSSHTARAPATIMFATAPNVGNALNIEAGGIFLNSANLTRGPSTSVNTTGDFHTYRIEVEGSSVKVLYDGYLVLSGSTFTDATFNTSEARIAFGDGSIYALGVSRWRAVRHNASSQSC